MRSLLTEKNSVAFPTNTGERLYQVPFFKGASLPAECERWQGTVDQMLKGVDCDGEMYLMVDQSFIKADGLHRRGGVHIDGNWDSTITAHGHPGPTHSFEKITGWATEPSWHMAKDLSGGLLLASDVSACKGYTGDFVGEIKEGGDCSGISTEGLKAEILKPHTVYLGNVTFLHESAPVKIDCHRTLVRITMPEDFEFKAA